MQFRTSLLTTTALLGLVSCSSAPPAVVPSATPETSRDDNATPLSSVKRNADTPSVAAGPSATASPIQLANPSDFSPWKLPYGDLEGRHHNYWSASISENAQWELSYRRVTKLQQSQITLRGTEENGTKTKRYSHTAFTAPPVQPSEIVPETKVLFNNRYAYWGRVLQLVDGNAEVQYVANGKLKQQTIAIEDLFPIHTSLDKFGTIVIWRTEKDRQWISGSTVLGTDAGVYVVADSNEMYFLPKETLIVNDQHSHGVGDSVLVKSENGQYWQPATVKEVVENHTGYMVQDNKNGTYLIDWAHIVRIPVVSQ